MRLIFAALWMTIGGTALGATLPSGLKWETNDSDPVFSSSDAKKGGTAYLAMSTFPLTFRVVGPDANSVLYRSLTSNQLSLTTLHPNTNNPVPVIATHWAYGKDKKSVYYKLNKAARWDDGKPVTADDFVFTLEFMKSKHLVAPWYNTYYGKTFEKIEKYDDHTISVHLKIKKPKIIYFADLPPTPKHFYSGKVDKDFVKKFNWKVQPVPGAYNIKKFKKGKAVTMTRKKNWWGENLRFFKNRFNVDKVVYKVVRENSIEYEWFKAGKLDFFSLQLPKYWHDKKKDKIYGKGFVEKLWFYNDAARSTYGLWMNKKNALFQDHDVRQAISHSINFKKVIDTILRGEFSRQNTVADGYGKYENPNVKSRRFDLAKADVHYKKAGWGKRGPDGIRVKKSQRMAATIVYSADAYTPWLVVLKEEAKKAGLELNLKKMDWSATLKAISGMKHEMVLMGMGGEVFPHYWDNWHSNSTDNLTYTKDKKLDKLIESYRSETNEPKKIKTSHEIQTYINEDASFVPAVTSTWVRVGYWRWWRFPKVRGTKISKSPLSLFHVQYGGLSWIDQKLKDETKKAMKKGKSFKPVVFTDETYKVKSRG